MYILIQQHSRDNECTQTLNFEKKKKHAHTQISPSQMYSGIVPGILYKIYPYDYTALYHKISVYK